MLDGNNENDDAVELTDIDDTGNSGKTLAEQEFTAYCEANEIDCDELAMDEDTHKDFCKIKKRFVKAITEKRLVVNGFKIEYTVSDKSAGMAGQKITIGRPTMRTMLAMDGLKDNQQSSKLLAYMTALCNMPKTEIHKISGLDKKDYQIIQDVAMLFLTA